MLKLSGISVGSHVSVEELLAAGPLRERMLAPGLTKGAMIALRKEEAALISVACC